MWGAPAGAQTGRRRPNHVIFKGGLRRAQLFGNMSLARNGHPDTGDQPDPMPKDKANLPRKRGIRAGAMRLALAAAMLSGLAFASRADASEAPYPTDRDKAKIDNLIIFYSKRYGVPVSLTREVVRSESDYRALARNGPYWGLMQIRFETAKALGYAGAPSGLLDAETNLAFGVAYLANAYKVGGSNMSRGHMLFRTGYYYEARRKRVLEEMITVDHFKPLGQSQVVIAAANEPETGELWSGDVADVPLGDGLAPLPRHKPGDAADPTIMPAVASPLVATPVVVQASIIPMPATDMPLPRPRPMGLAYAANVPTAGKAGGQPQVAQPQVAQPQAVAVLQPVAHQETLAELRALADASVGDGTAPVPVPAPVPGPVVARPTVVYASVLPIPHESPFKAPPSAPVSAEVTPSGSNSDVDSPVADAAAPLPRQRPEMPSEGEPIVIAGLAQPAAAISSAIPRPRPRPLIAAP